MVIVTNSILCLLAIYFFKQLIKYPHAYSKQMATFIVIMGISGCFGAAAHAVHYQLGEFFFRTIVYISNAMNLLSVYFCFRGTYTYFSVYGKKSNRYIIIGVLCWIASMLIFTLIKNNFLIIKIHAAIVLIYALVVHYLGYRKKDGGSAYVVLGIGISFLSIMVHSLKFSFDKYFNYKDIAHVIMIISLIIIYKGIKLNSDYLSVSYDFLSHPNEHLRS